MGERDDRWDSRWLDRDMMRGVPLVRDVDQISINLRRNVCASVGVGYGAVVVVGDGVDAEAES